jgi:hypothetical protein
MPDDTKTIRRPEAPEMSKAWETTCSAVLDGHQRAVTNWLQAVQALTDEVSSLAVARLQLAMEACSAVVACRSPEELIDCNRRLASKMTEHCSEEIAKLSQMTMRIALARSTDSDAH